EEVVNCPLCRSTFKHKDDLNRHLKVHSGQKPFACPKCDWKFSLNSNLRRHLRTHTKEKPHSCGYCKKTYAHLKNLKNHHMKHHSTTVQAETVISRSQNEYKSKVQEHE
ncbi:unnamed protein product, partial [Larinioides sclopetarius]